ncbi:metallophosphoesterase [Okeania hirsuta]|uniref:Metallophosphoesterase n=1 Tax=Okeania hirsuta TaxID=1458930 RepID=A0A3N6RQD5_9CYAN|nr:MULTISPECIES: metallophosphoesterase [Okeania]NET77151.1 metallophosphoesterase [Okeania sp. SIO1F9]RQH43251.1 metallophosphoesterase [Okeania hirsuta]
MSIKGRQFLFLSSLSSISVVGICSKIVKIINFFSPTNAVTLNNSSSVQTNPIFRFVSVADTGAGGKDQFAVAEAMGRYFLKYPFDFVILGGDNIYEDGEIEKIEDVFEKPYKFLLEKEVKFYACLGNHDIRTENGDLELKYPGFNMAGRYYTFQYHPIQFFALDTNINADWETELKWLEKELSNSEAPWKIVFGHHQIYSSGMYGLNEDFIQTLTPLFKKYGVQLYINGHEHDYERTSSINGTTYLICGAGGKQRLVGKSEWTEYSTSDFSFAAFDVYEDHIIVRGIDVNNRVFDEGIINLS